MVAMRKTFFLLLTKDFDKHKNEKALLPSEHFINFGQLTSSDGAAQEDDHWYKCECIWCACALSVSFEIKGVSEVEEHQSLFSANLLEFQSERI